MEPASSDDAHRRLDKSGNLAASLSHVETRQVRNDYTLRWGGKLYQIQRQAITAGLRRADVRVEQRLDGSLAVRHGQRYLPVKECAAADKPKATRMKKTAAAPQAARRSSGWNRNFDLNKGPKLWQAMRASGPKPGETF